MRIGNAFNYGSTVAVSLESNNNKLEVTIDDDGPEFRPISGKKSLKPFTGLKDPAIKETGGVGLGLSIA